MQTVYDQVYRQMYFNHGCNVIFSPYFYDFQDPWILKQAIKGYKMIGFFR